MSRGGGRAARGKTNTGIRTVGSRAFRFSYGEDAVQRIADVLEETREKKRAARKARKVVTLPKFNLPPLEDGDNDP